MTGLGRRALAGLAALAALAACADPKGSLTGERWDVERVAAMPMPEDERLALLFQGYLDLSRVELAEFDWSDGAEFAAKAETASGGALPATFAVADRAVRKPRLPELTAAEAEMQTLFAIRGAQLRAARELAEVQLAWDCWLQEAEEDHQTEQIELCRAAFDDAVARAKAAAELPPQLIVVLPEEGGQIGGVVFTSESAGELLLDKPFAAASGSGSVPVDKAEIEEAFSDALSAQPIPPSYFTLFFDYNSTRLDDAAAAVVGRIVEDIRMRPAAEVVVAGHSDAPGGRTANVQISRLRAAAVRRAILRELGSDRGAAFEISGTGDRILKVDTRERERENRRVEVTVR